MSFAFEENPHGIQQGRRSVSMEGERARCPAKRPRRQAGYGVKPGRDWAKREGRKMPPGGRPANCEPSGAGRSWKGGARERADDVFFPQAQKDVGAKRTLLRRGTPGATRTHYIPLRRSTPPIIRKNPGTSVIAENPRHYWIYRMVHVVSCIPRYSGSDWGFSYFSLASLARIK